MSTDVVLIVVAVLLSLLSLLLLGAYTLVRWKRRRRAHLASQRGVPWGGGGSTPPSEDRNQMDRRWADSAMDEAFADLGQASAGMLGRAMARAKSLTKPDEQKLS